MLPARAKGLSVLVWACFALGACGASQDDSGSGEGSPAAEGSGSASAAGGQGDDWGLVIPVETGGTGTDADGAGGTGIDISVMTDCARTEVTAVDSVTAGPADILMLVDSSPSMLEEIGFVRENLNEFSQQIIDSGVDARVILIAEAVPEDVQEGALGVCIDPPLGSGSCPDDTLAPKYVHIPRAVASTNSLDVLVQTSDEWKDYARPDAARSIFIISDDDVYYPQSVVFGDPPLYEDVDYMADSFSESFERVDRSHVGPWTMSAVFPFTQCAEADGVGELYAELIARTGGIAGDLCEQDFQPVFDRLAARVVEDAVTLSCEWELPEPVAGQTFSTELVQVTRTSGTNVTQELSQVRRAADCSAGAWHFDDPSDPKRILACPQTCDAMSEDVEGRIDVVFGCEIVEGCSATSATRLFPSADGDKEDLVTCAWPLPEVDSGNLVDPESLNVRYVTQSGFGVLLGQVEGAEMCASAELGWYYEGADEAASMVACPSTCETLQVAEPRAIEALFGCKSRLAVVR